MDEKEEFLWRGAWPTEVRQRLDELLRLEEMAHEHGWPQLGHYFAERWSWITAEFDTSYSHQFLVVEYERKRT